MLDTVLALRPFAAGTRNQKALESIKNQGLAYLVAWGGIEPPTQGFSIAGTGVSACSLSPRNVRNFPLFGLSAVLVANLAATRFATWECMAIAVFPRKHNTIAIPSGDLRRPSGELKTGMAAGGAKSLLALFGTASAPALRCRFVQQGHFD